ncbi:DUF411 domain-containing protein [Perlucidibaca piscinae]|jgi:hypothetical protein|uniref:DUF411 domain-containing protein n=1 Tax=Perlucidibaca piscinae TaxID=392589 RepID=UPI0003B71C04|nr:DUF411 domain-containing protein [Perlucidibaca piscinae]
MSRSRNTFWAIGLLVLIIGGLGALSLFSDKAPQPIAQAVADTIVVHKSPTCGCCGKWVDHLKAEGFAVEVHDEEDMNAVKSRLGIPARLVSCHTATVGGYLIEGHVAAADIKRLLQEKPKAQGLAVPGMPVGSPGMEVGDQRMPYETLLFNGEEATIYARHGE